MLRVCTIDGVEFTGETPDEIVAQMHQASHSGCATDAIYRREYADRAKFFVSYQINSEDSEVFLNDLMYCGFLKKTFPSEK